MAHKIVWSQDSAEDLEDIIQYINDRSGKEMAKSIYKRIIYKIENASVFPGSGRKVPELDVLGDSGIHEVIESPWRIIYRITENELHIISVIDGRRNVEELLYKKIIDGKMV